MEKLTAAVTAAPLSPTLARLRNATHPGVHPRSVLAREPIDRGRELLALQADGVPVVEGERIHVLPHRAELVKPPPG